MLLHWHLAEYFYPIEFPLPSKNLHFIYIEVVSRYVLLFMYLEVKVI